MMKSLKVIPTSIFFLLILAIFLNACTLKSQDKPVAAKLGPKIAQDNKSNLPENIDQNIENNIGKNGNQIFWHMKYIPANISDKELEDIKNSNISVLGTEWGMSDVNQKDVKLLLDRINSHRLKIILDAGFSPGAWGYNNDIVTGLEQKPVWQKELVQNWVAAFKNHPAIYGWDISNEAGENLTDDDSLRISLAQLKIAAADVRAVDSTHPIIIRMHYWDESDGDFGQKNPFDKNIADVVILNLYSNYSEDGKQVLLPNMINDSAQILINKIKAVDATARVWLCLAAYNEPPMFLKPSSQDVQRDLTAALKLTGIESIGFFGWGDKEDDWHLPRDGQNLLATIKQY